MRSLFEPARILTVVITASMSCAVFVGPVWAKNQSRAMKVCQDPTAETKRMFRACDHALKNERLDNGEKAVAWTNKGVAYAEVGRHEEAVVAYDTAELYAPDFTDIYINRALSSAKLGKVREVLADYGTVLNAEPNNLDALAGRGAFYLSRGLAEQALDDFDKLLEVDPANTDALYNRGLALMSLDRMAEAVLTFTIFINSHPDDAYAYLSRGEARATSVPADIAGAEADFKKASILSPEWAAPHVALGRIKERLGDDDSAVASYRRAFELGENSTALLSRIEALGG